MTATRNVPAYYSNLGRLRMLGGDPALDLANTTHWRDGSIIDFIPGYAALVDWSVPAKLLTAHEARSLQAQNELHPDEGAAVVRRWLQMRELFRHHLAMMTAEQDKPLGKGGASGAFNALGRELSLLVGETALTGFAGEFAGPDAKIAMDLPLARSFHAIMNLLMFKPHSMIRICEGDPCGAFFIDNSRSKPRRWCAMDACGNRAKVHRHREMKLA